MIKFRGKFTTTDLKEYRANPDLIYLPQIVYTYFSNPIKKCEECNCELLGGMEKKFTSKGYCSEWCRDESDETKQQMISAKNHICQFVGSDGTSCENDCRKIIRKGESYSSGVFSRYCTEHKGYSKRIYTHKVKKIKERKVKDLIGHTCSICKEYKTWDNFFKDKKGKYWFPCKECKKKKHNEWAKKNREVIKQKSKIYYHTFKKIKNQELKQQIKN